MIRKIISNNNIKCIWEICRYLKIIILAVASKHYLLLLYILDTNSSFWFVFRAQKQWWWKWWWWGRNVGRQNREWCKLRNTPIFHTYMVDVKTSKNTIRLFLFQYRMFNTGDTDNSSKEWFFLFCSHPNLHIYASKLKACCRMTFTKLLF